MIKNLKVPEERIGVLKADRIKLEKSTSTKIKIEKNSVSIEGDPIRVWETIDVVKAIGRGFNPDKSLQLIDEDKILHVINIKDFRKTDKAIKRIKSRIIGSEGKTKRRLEEMSDCMISVYGKTVSIIGDSKKVPNVKDAIEMFINGSKHNKVYNYLSRCSDE